MSPVPPPPPSVIAAIIAGGRAKRLGGQPKGMLVVGGQRIIDRQLAVLRATFPRLILVTNEPELWAPLGLSMVSDRVPPGAGPLAGIDAALSSLTPSETAVVCVGGDMPFLDRRALELVRDHAPAADAVVSRVGVHADPLFARYARGCAAAIQAELAAGRFKMTDFLTGVRSTWLEEAELRTIDPELSFLENVNTPADLARARAHFTSCNDPLKSTEPKPKRG